MKTRIMTVLVAALLLVACTDSNEVRDVKGAYRYKTTGKVTLEENYRGATKADTLVANLDNESGTLELVSLHDGDSLLMTIDQLNGDVIVTRGAINGKRLNFASFTRKLEVPTEVKTFDTISLGVGILSYDTVLVREVKEYEPYDITVRGYADVYDDNLVFTLEYNGKSQTSERTLRGKGIKSLAKKN